MLGLDVPDCPKCGAEPLEMVHILMHCNAYTQQRTNYDLPNDYLAQLGENCLVPQLM